MVAEGKLLPSLRELFEMLTTFMLTVFAWIFFRAENIYHAFSYIGEIFSKTIIDIPVFIGMGKALGVLCYLMIFLCMEWFGRKDEFAINSISVKTKRPFRWFLYLLIFYLVISHSGGQQEFIYFQF